MKINQAKRISSGLNLRRHYKLSESVLRGNRNARKKLAQSSLVWITHSDPKTKELFSEPNAFYSPLINWGLLEKTRVDCVWPLVMHIANNAEHIAPLPVLSSATMISGDLIIHARDFGKGLGEYLKYVGLSYSTRPDALRVKLGLEDQGNGLLLAFNQVLNGCQGRVVIESSNQKILLWKSNKKILGQKIPRHRLRGTRFTLFFPLNQKWTQESSGWDKGDLPQALKIKFLSE